MAAGPVFPTPLHQQAANVVTDYFLSRSDIDTILVVNSCARGQAVPESDLDFAILAKSDLSIAKLQSIENQWLSYRETQSAYLAYKKSSPFAHIHLDVIDGRFEPTDWDDGGGPDSFEVEVGNRIAYSAPMDKPGTYFRSLQDQWLPYYNEELRLKRLAMCRQACEYDLAQIPFLVNRGLFFHAFDKLYKAFQEFLQTLFIAHRTYPIAYNKWIRDQIEQRLNLPELYPKLSPVLSVNNIESKELISKADRLAELVRTYINN